MVLLMPYPARFTNSITSGRAYLMIWRSTRERLDCI